MEVPVEVIREVERIVEVPVKVIREVQVIKEVFIQPSKDTNTKLVSIEAKTSIAPPKTQQDFSSFSALDMSSEKPSVDVNLTSSSIDLSYKGIQAPKSSISNPDPKHKLVIDKLQNRIKIYEDKNIELMIELDKMKNQSSCLYSKLNEKQLESSSSQSKMIDQVGYAD